MVDAAPSIAEEVASAAVLPDDAIVALSKAIGVSDPETLKFILDRATSQLNASHKAEIAALREEIQSVRVAATDREGSVQNLNESAGGYPWMYYRIPMTFPDEGRRGWVTMGPGGASPSSGNRDTGSFNRYLKKGFIPITKYGLCPVPTSNIVAQTYEAFVKRGGAAEFPASQIVSYQWHKHNPFAALGVKWTQLEGILDKLSTFTCEYCGYSLDFMPGDPMVGTAYRQHLVNADKVTFKEAIEAVKAAGLTTTPFRNRSIDDIIRMSNPNE